jgi:5'-nucleotidase
MNRRKFVKAGLFQLALGYVNTLPLTGLVDDDAVHVTILHTNDVHSRIDPFPVDGSRNSGQGGVAKRAAIIDDIRMNSSNVLLFDAGDIFQGTPYFNMFGGELEIKLMSKLGYSASTMGNHDFDAGIDGFVKQMPHAQFPFVVSNYDFSDTPLNGKIKTNVIYDFEGYRVGVYGLGIELRGLVAPENYGDVRYLDPLTQARGYERLLRNELECDFIVCLSHLGYRYENSKISDVLLAQNTNHTDLIIGGHTHTFMQEPVIEKNLNGHPVIINQVGFAGILLGKIDLYFDRANKRRRMDGINVLVN